MASLNRVSQFLQTWILEHYSAKPSQLAPTQPVFSFSFDDAPVSSMIHGAQILERADARGTYYVALGLASKADERCQGPVTGAYGKQVYCLSEEEIVELHRRGHHIGCHGYSHRRPDGLSTEWIVTDCERNQKRLSALLSSPIDHYSFPYGKVRAGVKRVLNHRYASMRSIVGGINLGRVDLSHLRANAVYSTHFDRAKLQRLIEHNLAVGGWTIFYTHEVCEHPNPWGTTIDDFQWLVDQVKQSGAAIETVEGALQKLKE